MSRTPSGTPSSRRRVDGVEFMIYALLVALQALLKLTRFAFVALLGVGLGLALGLRSLLALALPADAGALGEQLLLRRRTLLARGALRVLDLLVVLQSSINIGEGLV